MAKKVRTEEEIKAIKLNTSRKATVLAYITGALALFVGTITLKFLCKPLGTGELYNFIIGLLDGVLFSYIILPLGITFGGISVITAAMGIKGKGFIKKFMCIFMLVAVLGMAIANIVLFVIK